MHGGGAWLACLGELWVGSGRQKVTLSESEREPPSAKVEVEAGLQALKLKQGCRQQMGRGNQQPTAQPTTVGHSLFISLSLSLSFITRVAPHTNDAVFRGTISRLLDMFV